jgi:hypothetical protein
MVESVSIGADILKWGNDVILFLFSFFCHQAALMTCFPLLSRQ